MITFVVAVSKYKPQSIKLIHIYKPGLRNNQLTPRNKKLLGLTFTYVAVMLLVQCVKRNEWWNTIRSKG